METSRSEQRLRRKNLKESAVKLSPSVGRNNRIAGENCTGETCRCGGLVPYTENRITFTRIVYASLEMQLATSHPCVSASQALSAPERPKVNRYT